VEKNDTSERNYFSSNKHDAPGEIIRSDYQLNELQRGGGYGNIRIVCGRRGPTAREIWTTGRVVGSKQ
jgi:hypothetical protein